MTQSFRASNSECWVQVPEVRQGLPLQSAGVGRPKDAHKQWSNGLFGDGFVFF